MSGSAVALPSKQQNFSEILQRSANKALGGGIAGASAMVVQVSTLMWMRTAMNYQYRYGSTTSQALKHLYAEGGILRFYRGYVAALAQGPLSRFGDTAANVGVLAVLNSDPKTRDLDEYQKTFFVSAVAAGYRVFLTPVDTVKTIMQVEGKQGLKVLFEKASRRGPTVYYHGAVAAATATFTGSYPFWATYNTLQKSVPKYEDTSKKLLRSAGIGFASSFVSDSISNPLRVIKTCRQTNADTVSYFQTIKTIVDKEGIVGLWGRGLKTRILTNGMQAMMFTVMWNQIMDLMKKQGYSV